MATRSCRRNRCRSNEGVLGLNILAVLMVTLIQLDQATLVRLHDDGP